ncbi:hypothetical protein PanWU01x14_033480 [Parasponia andersonii]|uniref:Uncharacterized protein n=1 Tax=Parasponia andersonii TaxID=3476 RepID=A0A2P5DTQ5_PARAD|nr:hypothetical protein PanWU01x14_033480 [Parasponia andersonii]
MKGLFVPRAEVLGKESTAWSWVCCGSDLVENRLAWKPLPLVRTVRTMEEFDLIAVRTIPSFDIFMFEASECDGRSASLSLGSEAAELVVVDELEIGEGVLHLVNEDKLERLFGVGEGVVGDEK